MNRGQLETFCTSEWPTFGVGCPPEGTLNLSLITAVNLIVTGNPGPPDQDVYIERRQELAQDMPRWLQQCARVAPKRLGTPGKKKSGSCCGPQPNGPQTQILVARGPKHPIYQGHPEDDQPISPPPYGGLPTAPPGPDTRPPSVSPPPEGGPRGPPETAPSPIAT